MALALRSNPSMRVLITGGTGLIGRETVDLLLRRGHLVRVLSRDPQRIARAWGDAVEAHEGDIGAASMLAGSANGCDAVLHIAGIAREQPPEITFGQVNVTGTENVVRESTRARVRRLVYVSSLGVDRGSSDYHDSKRRGETIVRGFAGEWVIVRPGNVYGSGDQVISKLLEWVRSSPVVPIIGGGHDVFQPIWSGDVAAALVAALERADIAGRTLEIAGPDRTTLVDLLDRMVAIVERSPPRIPIPASAVAASIDAAELVGIELPIDEGQLRMLGEGNFIPDDADNALTGILGLTATGLDEGLRQLADAAPEQLPGQGFGPMQMRVFFAESENAAAAPEEIVAQLRNDFQRFMPGLVQVGVEPGSGRRLETGATLTLSVPVRGHVQVRVADVTPTDVTLLTLRGHPLAGAVRFRAARSGESLRFEVHVYDRAASITDFALMALGGSVLQARAWEEFVRNVMAAAGVRNAEVRSSAVTLDDEQAARVQRWLEDVAASLNQEPDEPRRSSGSNERSAGFN